MAFACPDIAGGDAVCSELQGSWNRDDAAQWAEAYAAVFPPYQLLIESYTKAQQAVNAFA